MTVNTQTETPVTANGGSVIPEQVGTLSVQPTTGLYMSQDHRYWHNGIGPIVSVTTALRVLAKPALDSWYKRQVAEAAVNRIADWQPMTQPDAIRWLMSMPDATRDNAASIGSSVHLLADLAGRATAGSTAFQIPDGTLPYLEAFQAFLSVSGGSQGIVSSEKAVLNLSEGFAGTFDLLMVIRDELWLLDVKSGKGVYPDYALQLAAYGMAEHIALPGDPVLYDFPEPKRYGVLHLRPDKYAKGYRLIEYAITDRERLAFLAALELWRWIQERSPRTQLTR